MNTHSKPPNCRRDALVRVIDQFDAANLTGLTPDDLIVDGQLHRFRPSWEPKKKRAWYILFDFKTDSGAELISGSFGWFKGADAYSFNIELSASKALSPAERQRFDHEQAESRRKAEQMKQAELQAACARALRIWNGCNTSGHSAYLQRKRIAGVSVRYSKGTLVVPVHDFDGGLFGVQFIYANGDKVFMTGTQKKGHFCLLGAVVDATGYVGVAEGYATGVSCYMAMQWPVFVAFDAGNLQPVAVAIRARYPVVKIVIFADDDVDRPDNPGRNKAEAAARAVGGVVFLPPAVEVANG